MVTITEHYDAFPYPERDPADEARRLIVGSPSHPLEIDHWLFGGARDWRRPFRALVAGGGTGDGLIQLAQVLHAAGRPYRITYIDLSRTARALAEARAAARGLDGITFRTGSLLDAPDFGPFDYIDCCGVLHHLPNPPAGFRALRAALADGGGMGFMVYAPYGRSGVYPLQEAFGALFAELAPEDRLSAARALLRRLPDDHPFRRNRLLSDHRDSDAGFYDLLLHGQDRPYDVGTLLDMLEATGWRLQGFATPALYDLARLTERPSGLSDRAAMAIAEKLRGTLRMHIGYAVPTGSEAVPARATRRDLVPHLRGVAASALAKAVARGSSLPIRMTEARAEITLPTDAARMLALVDGRRSVATIATQAGVDPVSAGRIWASVDRDLVAWGLMLYSRLHAGDLNGAA